MEIYKEFNNLIKYLKKEKRTNIQQILKNAQLKDVPEDFHSCFKFYKSLSGDSRNLFLDHVIGRKQRKIFVDTDKNSKGAIKNKNSLAYREMK